jgi:Ca-activated chloride channel family protein
MRKTIALFAVALALLLAAVVIGLRRQPPPPQPVPETIVKVDVPPPTVEPGRSTISIGDVVKLDGSLSNGFVRAGQAGNVSLMIDLLATDQTSTARAPMAVAIVIDRSGSMAGEKIQKARQATKAFAARLSDEDSLAIITFSSDYSVDLPLTNLKGQRTRIERVIDEILDGGGTDIGGGMNAGIQALRTAQDGAIHRLVLVSDGNANQGITDPNALAAIAKHAHQEGITVSTLGVGLDFNEDLLTQMASVAGGGYYYARDAESIAAAFDKELSGINKLAARNVEVGLELGNGVAISEVYGYRTEMRRGRQVITVGDMAAGERRRVLVQLTTPAASDRIDVSNVVLSYTSAAANDTREHQGSVSVAATTNDSELASGEQRDVVEAFEAAIAARARETAAFNLQAGNKAQALVHLKKQIEATRSRAVVLKSAALDQQVSEMEETVRGMNAAPVDSDDAKDIVKSEKLRARQVFAY